MKIRIYHIFLISALITFLLVAFTAKADTVTGDFEVSSDNEGLSITRYLVGYNDRFADWTLGVKHGKFSIAEPNGNATMNDTRLTFYHGFDQRFQLSGYVGSLYNNGWATPTADINATYIATKDLNFEANIEKNAIDSFKGINRNLTFSGYTLSAEYKLTPQLTGVGIYSAADMSDGNARRKHEGRLIYDIKSVDGLNVQYHHSKTTHDFYPVEYFAPAKWTRDLFGAGYHRRFGPDYKWLFSGRILSGAQGINSSNGTFTELKLNLDYPLSRSTKIKLSYTQILSVMEGYEYKWNWVAGHVNYRF